ncbi:uncharacterized protein LOC113873689 [Abrus precatorius]|uniref:Uncharacterized protein LOC113873689 n=1 Tax=Abrus precatorius TaxID=3816 RepID=A0A8B8MG97_ABRPR|nr:uncharacterized protein LOC113873689 [Abrus precatorius]
MDISASNSSKKRKICREEGEEDEAKMETFFALVRSIRETRDRWIGFRSGEGKNKRSNKEETRVTVWKPTFQVEDFAEQVQNGNRDPSLGLLEDASRSKECGKEEEDAEKGIDLRLSL